MWPRPIAKHKWQGFIISGWSHHLFTRHASASSLMLYESQIYYTKIGANTCYLSYLTQWLKCLVLEYDNTTSWQLFCEMKLLLIMPSFFFGRAWGWGVEHLILHCCSTFSCLAVITLLFKLLIFKEITSSKHWKSRNYLRVDGNFLTTWNNCGTCVKCIFFFVFSTHYLIFRQFTTHLPTYIY